jgi:hypothetical protein
LGMIAWLDVFSVVCGSNSAAGANDFRVCFLVSRHSKLRAQGQPLTKFAPGEKFASVGYGGYVACYYKSIIYRTDCR